MRWGRSLWTAPATPTTQLNTRSTLFNMGILSAGIFLLAVDRSSLPFQHIERSFEVKSIGTVSSPYLSKYMTPKQATVMNNGTLQIGSLRLFEQYRDCLHYLEGFDYCW